MSREHDEAEKPDRLRRGLPRCAACDDVRRAAEAREGALGEALDKARLFVATFAREDERDLLDEIDAALAAAACAPAEIPCPHGCVDGFVAAGVGLRIPCPVHRSHEALLRRRTAGAIEAQERER